MSKTIERKFLVSKLPNEAITGKSETIQQGYIFLSNKNEIKIQQTGQKYTQTIKIDSELFHKEIEISLIELQFKKLWKLTKEKRINKTRYKFNYNEKTIEIDKFEGPLKGLVIARVKFNSIKEAFSFKKPLFFLEEITYDSRYKNKHLATMNNTKIKNLLNMQKNDFLIGTLPFYKKNKEIKVVFVTTRNGKHWIFPKGHPEKEMLDTEVALMEAKEEAGINGTIAGPPILLPYFNNGKTFNMLAFPIEVKKLSKNWEESKIRNRKKVSVKEALKFSNKNTFRGGIEYIEMLASLL